MDEDIEVGFARADSNRRDVMHSLNTALTEFCLQAFSEIELAIGRLMGVSRFFAEGSYRGSWFHLSVNRAPRGLTP